MVNAPWLPFQVNSKAFDSPLAQAKLSGPDVPNGPAAAGATEVSNEATRSAGDHRIGFSGGPADVRGAVLRRGLLCWYQEPFPSARTPDGGRESRHRASGFQGTAILGVEWRRDVTDPYPAYKNVGGAPWLAGPTGDTVALEGWPVGAGTLTFVSDRGDEGRRLDLVLLRHLASWPGVSRTRVQALIRAGRVEIGGRPWTRVAQRVPAAARVTLALPEGLERRGPVAGEDIALAVLHEDDWLLAVNKPPGLIVHPSYGHRAGTLINALVHYAKAWPAGRPSLVHRLDKHTSGVLLVAKSREAHAACARTLARPETRKEYLALCYGRLRRASLRIGDAIGPDPADRRRMVVRPDGMPAATSVRRIETSRGSARGLTLVCCRLLTGRMHQIRVHLQSNGLPIVGDPVYGEPFRSGIPDVALDAQLRAFGRQALHAWRLSLTHPMTDEPLSIEAPAPPDFTTLLSKCGLSISDFRVRTA